MKNMKKVISLFLALIMCLGSFVFTASAEGETFTEDYYTYIIENGGATITDVYKNIAGDVVIPDTLGGYPVKKIYNAFNDCHYITSVDMPDTVEEIDMSFGACYKLEDVNLSENLATLDESFSSCYSLTEINIPGSVEYLSGFRYCYALENVEFELNCDIETIGFAAFDFCYSLKDFDIPYGVEKIENHAFEGCYSLGRVYIPATVKSIGKYAFHECDLRALHIPEGVEVIGENAFDACNKLEYAYIPASLKSIGEGAFFNCSDLKNVFVEGTDTSFDGKSFGYSDHKVENMTQDEVVEIMFLQAQFSKDYALADANGDKAALEEINSRVPELEALLTKLENAIVFYDEPVLENQLTVNGYKNSTAEAYATENGLYFEELGNEITEGWCGENIRWNFDKATGKLTLTGSGEMYDCSYAADTDWYENELFPYVKSIEVGEGITTIGGGAFYQCYKAESVSLPSTLKEIGKIAFAQCVSLKEIDLPQGLEKLGEGCFGACMSLEEITIPAKVKEIPAECFGDCCSLKTVYLPNSLEKIGERVFEGCYLLSTLTIPEAVTSIGYRAFRACPTLKSLYILNPDFDFDVTDTYIGKWIWLVDADDRVGFFDNLVSKYVRYSALGADIAFGVVDEDSVRDKLEAAQAEIDELNSKMENLQVYIGSGDDDYTPSTLLTVYGFKNSTAEAYSNKIGIKFSEIIDKETVADQRTNTEAEFDKGTFPSDVQMKVEKGGENANFVFSGLFSRYESYDISFESDGERVQPDGTVKISIKLPLSFNSKNTKVYYVDENGNKTLIPSEYIDGYIVFETDHFSEYVLVDESSKIEEPSEPETPEEPSDECNCKCHKNFMTKILYKILNFFRKLFGASPCCEC